MKKSFYKEAVNKLMDYNKRYPDSPLKCAFKAGSFGFIWALFFREERELGNRITVLLKSLLFSRT